MIAHDAQTLMALHRCDKSHLSLPYSDLGIMLAGMELFGREWTSMEKGARHHYAPLVNMSLGRLRRLGLVRGEIPRTGVEYSLWVLTDEGRAEAVRLLGPSEGPS